MARVTVEDCVQIIPNRYELVLVAAQRARDVSSGSPITVERDNDKNTVVALREIAGQSINLDDVRNHIVNGVNRMGDVNEEDEALMAVAGQALATDVAEASVGVVIEEVVFESVEGAAPMDELGGEDDMTGEDGLDAGDLAEGGAFEGGAEESLA
ncbi:MAG: DNA-directed RNA polymerase subunit omega [Alphaproteobacteria bacterium]